MIDSSEKCKIYVSLLSNFRVCELLKSAVSILWQWCRFVFLFIGRELTTWPANNCLQIMVCSCSVSSNCVWLQIILCSCINETALFCFFASLLLENGRSLCFSKKFIKKHKLSDQTIKKKNYWTPVITKYLDLSVCLTDQLFAEAEGSPLTNHDILVNLVQK